MSQVFSFRLDPNNPREAQAMQIVEVWASKGYSLRYTLVEVLLAYTDEDAHRDTYSSALEQIISMLEGLLGETRSTKSESNQDKGLSEPFLKAIAKTTRPGLRVE